MHCLLKNNKDSFLRDFSESLAGVVPKYDQILCVSTVSLRLTSKQQVTEPTQEHALNLVLSYGLPVVINPSLRFMSLKDGKSNEPEG